jgi:hypothetical protein
LVLRSVTRKLSVFFVRFSLHRFTDERSVHHTVQRNKMKHCIIQQCAQRWRAANLNALAFSAAIGRQVLKRVWKSCLVAHSTQVSPGRN